MTTQALAQTINIRHQLTLEDLIRVAPQLAAAIAIPLPTSSPVAPSTRRVSDADYSFWTTFAFGCAQAIILFGMIYAYFAN
jgi:hypothetical protein